jgi:hypothetical protein
VLLTSPITLKEHDHLCKSRACAVSNIPAGNQLPSSGDWILRGRKKFRWLHGNPSTWSMQSTWHFKEKSLNSACEQGHSVSSWASTENLLSVSILYPCSPIRVLSEIPTSEIAIKLGLVFWATISWKKRKLQKYYTYISYLIPFLIFHILNFYIPLLCFLFSLPFNHSFFLFLLSPIPF